MNFIIMGAAIFVVLFVIGAAWWMDYALTELKKLNRSMERVVALLEGGAEKISM